jgi:hypothetical protein
MSAACLKFESERELADAVVSRLARVVDVIFSCEAPVVGRSADVALFRDDELHTIEFKLHDWRQAIRQAIDHQLGADFAYVCMPRRRVTDPMRDAFAEAGVGLLFFAEADWPFEIVFEATRSTGTWCVAYERLKAHIHQRQHGS